jgi:DoxX-like family
MQSDIQTISTSKGSAWTGRIVSALPIVFLLLDGIAKLFKPAPVVEGTVRLGYPESAIIGLGIVLIACTVLYAIPRTSVLGSILLTGYLGGATATHVRVGDSLFSILFPSIVALFVWGGLYLREDRLRELVPLRS